MISRLTHVSYLKLSKYHRNGTPAVVKKEEMTRYSSVKI